MGTLGEMEPMLYGFNTDRKGEPRNINKYSMCKERLHFEMNYRTCVRWRRRVRERDRQMKKERETDIKKK